MHSSYEIAVAQDLDTCGIAWIRPKSAMLWVDVRGESHRYYADFYLPDYGVFLDPKNAFLIQKDKMKIQAVREQNGVSLLVLSKDQLRWETIKSLILEESH